MSDVDDKKETGPRKSPDPDLPTNPHLGTPEPSQPASALFLSDRALRDIAQRFDLLNELGRGGMGVVFRTRDRETGEIVALKVLNPEIATRPDLIERFKTELRLARKITHKNVCRSYDLHRFGETVVIAMEYVEGESLRAVLNRPEGISLRGGMKWASQICAALSEAHTQGIVHRDLKPENIVIDRSGQAKVMDFGIARSLDTTTITGVMTGTPAYMGPEQAEGKPADARSDIYSLGLILYEMFTGQPGFRAESPIAMALKQIHETPPPPRDVEPHLPPFLEGAIQKCLEKNPKNRFQSVAELEASLEERSIPQSTDGEPTPAPHLSVWGRRDWVLLALGTLGLFCFLRFRNNVFPATKLPIEVNAIAARRAAEDLAMRLGRPFPSPGRAELEYHGELYWESDQGVVFGSIGSPRHNRSAGIEIPIYWRVVFNRSDPLPLLSPHDDHFALVNRQGQVREFSDPYSLDSVPRSYQPPPNDQRRNISRVAVEAACGPMPSNAMPIETSGGERGAYYTVTFSPALPAGSPPFANASLLAEKVTNINCKPPESRASPLDMLFMAGLAQGATRFLVAVALIAIVVYFGVGQCYRSPALKRRVPLALTLGIAAVWLLAPTFNYPSSSGIAGPAPSIPVLFGGGLAAAGLTLIALITVEYYFIRRTPAWIATYVMAWRGRCRERAVGLALVRGALGGLFLIGWETLILLAGHPSTEYPDPLNLTDWVLQFGGPNASLGGWADPSVVGQAATSFSPAFFVIVAAIFNGVTLGLIIMGSLWPWSFISRPWSFISRPLKHPSDIIGRSFQISFGLALGAALATTAFRLPLGQTLGTVIGPFFLSYMIYMAAAIIFATFDALTVIMAIGTAVLWILNYPLLQIFQELGNGGQWAVFVGWCVIVLAGAGVGFGPYLSRARQRLTAEMQ